MSVARILDPLTGKIEAKFLPTGPQPAHPYVENPMVDNLDANNLNIDNLFHLQCAELIPGTIEDVNSVVGQPGSVLESTGVAVQWVNISRDVGTVIQTVTGPFEITGNPVGPQFTIPKEGAYLFSIYIDAETLVVPPAPIVGTNGVEFNLFQTGIITGVVPNSKIIFTYDELKQYSAVSGGNSEFLGKQVIVFLLKDSLVNFDIGRDGAPTGGSIKFELIQMC